VQSWNFQKRLKSVGVPCELLVLQGAPHGLLTWDKFDPGYRTAMVAWLQRTLETAKR
jgi:acetyl esterase/lipase